ncbi:hypothetical protein [Streptomyces sp. NPDC006463]|uniref:hypothetical protein n=1 Tax=Streptomyces sp. NPDC006463 TaxID=3364746 RepID=UPI0036B888B9
MATPPDPSSRPTTQDATATADLKSTAKWLLGASASSAAVLVAGLQLGNLEALGNADVLYGAAALASVAIALAAATTLLFLAARVLSTSRPAISQLQREDIDDNGARPGKRMNPPDDPRLRELVWERGPELLGERDSIWKIVEDHESAAAALSSSNTVVILEKRYRPSRPADAEALRNIFKDLDRRIQEICDAAGYIATREHYKDLKQHMCWLLPLFGIGILSFAWLTFLYPPLFLSPSAKVTTPIQVEITVPSDAAASRAGLPAGCVKKTPLKGVAVGGKLDSPILVTRSENGCPARRVKNSKDLITVPLSAPSAPAASPSRPCDTHKPHLHDHPGGSPTPPSTARPGPE